MRSAIFTPNLTFIPLSASFSILYNSLEVGSNPPLFNLYSFINSSLICLYPSLPSTAASVLADPYKFNPYLNPVVIFSASAALANDVSVISLLSEAPTCVARDNAFSSLLLPVNNLFNHKEALPI